MADEVCGPSNALQQFKQQTQHDRTLQQDRLINRHSPAQGFRSANPNAGLLDPEFEAFQAGFPAPDLPQFQHGPPQFQQQHYQEVPHAPSWATDFNRMSLASPPPMQQHHAPAPSTTNWAQGFQAHVAQNAPRAQNSSPSPYAFQQRARYGANGLQSNFAQPGFAPAGAMQGKGKERVIEQFDEAAFERAFDMAREDMLADEAPAQTFNGNQMDTEEIVDLIDKTQGAHQFDRSNSERSGLHNDLQNLQPADGLQTLLQDNILESEAQKEELKDETKEDDDALAATAQELLHKVEHNQTDKFKNSQFLNLMRKLRDREVKVRGDQMIETVSAIHPSRTSTPDSTYCSGTSSPGTIDDISTQSHQHNPTICKTSHCDVLEDHRFDHWESPYT